MIYLPRGVPVREKVNPARINLPEAMGKLRDGTYTGYLRFDTPEGTGVLIFESGKLVSALFLSSDGSERLIAYDAIARIFEDSILGSTTLNIFRLTPKLAIAIHTLLHGRYLCQGQDLQNTDLDKLLQRIKDEQINGCLRVYAQDKSVLIFYEQGKALGFFHEGGTDIVTTADLSRSVARLEGAKLDLLETAYASDTVLADLMASADLGPIWLRARKLLLEERRQREEKAIRSQEDNRALLRQRSLLLLKTIARNYIGKFGVAQVDKAFGQVGPEMKAVEMEAFYAEIERLATLVAGPKKVSSMLAEMRSQLSLEK